MNKKDILLSDILSHFGDCPLPSLNSIYSNERCMVEHCTLLGRYTWSESDIQELRFRDDIIVSLSPAGFLYYLPAFLSFILLNYKDADVLGDSVIDRLTPPLNNMGEPRLSWLDNVYNKLTLDQKMTVKKVLLYLYEKYDDGFVDDALEAFWFEFPE